MASGKPIISNVQMGYSIIQKYDCGLELEKGDAQELAEAILEIKNMERKNYQKMGESAKAGAKDFDFKKLTAKLVHIIEALVN